MRNVSLGCDPELFLEIKGKICPAVGLIGGSKAEPLPISNEGHAIQEDNVAIEYNIPPSFTKQQFIDNNNFVLEYLTELVSKKYEGFLVIKPSHYFDKADLQTEQAKVFGCDPDFDVYRECPNDPPEGETNLRVCGGHVAVGWEDYTFEEQINLVKAMDITLGLSSLFLDSDTERRKMYGKAGCFRFKDFGIEYRTLSNFWISSDETMSIIWDLTLLALDLVFTKKINNLVKNYSTSVVTAINTANLDLAYDLLQKIFKNENEIINKVCAEYLVK